MPIIIKEIIVKTTIHRQTNASVLTAETVKHLKELVVKEVERKHQKKEKWAEER